MSELHLLEDKFKLLESRFDSIERKITSISLAKERQHSQALQTLHNDQNSNQIQLHDSIRDKLNASRALLIDKLEDNEAETTETRFRLNFEESSADIMKDPCVLVGQYVNQNQQQPKYGLNSSFSLVKKFKYLDFFDQFEKIDLDGLEQFHSQELLRIRLLTRGKILISMRPHDTEDDSEQSLKIFNRHFECIAVRFIKKGFIIRNLITWKSQVASLFHEKATSLYHVDIYDEYLKLIATRSFSTRIKLCSMNDNEVFVWSQSEEKCHIYDCQAMQPICVLGQNHNCTEPFYLSGGTLIDASDTQLLYYSADAEEQKQFLRILSRKSGACCGQIAFDFLYFTKIIKIDSHSNILVKLNQNNVIKYFDRTGVLLYDFHSNEFNKFNSLIEFNLTHDNQIVCYDKSQNKIFVL